MTLESNNNCVVIKKNLKKQNEKEEGKYWSQILAIFIVSLGNFTTGLLFAWSSPYAVQLVEDKINYNITKEEASLFIVYEPLGMLLGCTFIFKLTEYLGRKKSVLAVTFPYVIAWAISIVATNKWHFYLSRLIEGVGDALVFCSIPPYVGEITVPTIRGYFGNTPTFILYTGELVILILGSYFNVKFAGYICIGIPIIYFILVLIILPESPYQLIKDAKHKEAKESIKWLQRKTNIDAEYLQIKMDVERQISESATWKDLWIIESNRKALQAGMFLRFSQQLCGVSVFSAYAQSVFQLAGTKTSAETASMIFIGTIWILNLICNPAVERYGRKLTFFYSILSSGIILIILGVYFALDQYKVVDMQSISWFPLAGMAVWTISYSFGLGIVPTLMLGELFSASVKSKGLSVLMIVFSLAVLLTTNLFNFVTTYIGLYGIFLLYGVCCLISSAITLSWVPETKGKSLEEIQQALKK